MRKRMMWTRGWSCMSSFEWQTNLSVECFLLEVSHKHLSHNISKTQLIFLLKLSFLGHSLWRFITPSFGAKIMTSSWPLFSLAPSGYSGLTVTLPSHCFSPLPFSPTPTSSAGWRPTSLFQKPPSLSLSRDVHSLPPLLHWGTCVMSWTRAWLCGSRCSGAKSQTLQYGKQASSIMETLLVLPRLIPSHLPVQTLPSRNTRLQVISSFFHAVVSFWNVPPPLQEANCSPFTQAALSSHHSPDLLVLKDLV